MTPARGAMAEGNVNAILKTGSRELHGDVYEFFRNDALNANEYFHNATGQARPPVKTKSLRSERRRPGAEGAVRVISS